MLERSEASPPGQALRPFAALKGDNETALPLRAFSNGAARDRMPFESFRGRTKRRFLGQALTVA